MANAKREKSASWYFDLFDQEKTREMLRGYKRALSNSRLHIRSASETIAAYYYFKPKNISVSIKNNYGKHDIFYTEISERNLDIIKGEILSLGLSGKKRELNKAEKLLKKEIYLAGASEMANDIDFAIIAPKQKKDLQSEWHVSSPIFKAHRCRKLNIPSELFDQIFEDVDKDEYFRNEMINLKKFIKTNWSAIITLSDDILDNFELEGKDLITKLKRLNISA